MFIFEKEQQDKTVYWATPKNGLLTNNKELAEVFHNPSEATLEHARLLGFKQIKSPATEAYERNFRTLPQTISALFNDKYSSEVIVSKEERNNSINHIRELYQQGVTAFYRDMSLVYVNSGLLKGLSENDAIKVIEKLSKEKIHKGVLTYLIATITLKVIKD